MKTSFLAVIAATIAAAPALAAPVAETDFLNFTYQAGQEKVTVTNGEFSRDDPSNRLFFKVLNVRRGDLNGDGVPEALVLTAENGGGSGYFTDGYLYTDGQSGPSLVATLGIGDRADGGIFDARIVGGKLVEERFGQVDTGACCPTQIVTTALAWRSGKLGQVGKTTKRAYIYSGSGTGSRPAELKFLPGTTTGTVEGDGFRRERVVFKASKGQLATIAVRRPEAPRLQTRVTLTIGTRRLAVIASGSNRSVRLPATGTYSVRFANVGGNRKSDDATGTADITIR